MCASNLDNTIPYIYLFAKEGKCRLSAGRFRLTEIQERFYEMCLFLPNFNNIERKHEFDVLCAITRSNAVMLELQNMRCGVRQDLVQVHTSGDLLLYYADTVRSGKTVRIKREREREFVCVCKCVCV